MCKWVWSNLNAGCNKDLNKLSEVFKRYCFPSHLIDKIIKQYLSTPKQNPNKNVSNDAEDSNVHYIKLPYIGHCSRFTQIKIRQLHKHFCKDLSIKLVFSIFKIKTFFSFKDLISTALKSFMVYKFIFAGFNSHYIGEISHYFLAQIKKHILTDQNSHVFKHLNNLTNCKKHYTPICFKNFRFGQNYLHTQMERSYLHPKYKKTELNIQI